MTSRTTGSTDIVPCLFWKPVTPSGLETHVDHNNRSCDDTLCNVICVTVAYALVTTLNMYLKC